MIQLEKLLDNSPAARNLDALRRLTLDTGGISAGVRFGSVTVTWPGGAALSTTMTVTHGLGRVPAIVLATPNSQAGTGACVLYTDNHDADSFDVRLETNGGFTPANTATTPTSWLVMG